MNDPDTVLQVWLGITLILMVPGLIYTGFKDDLDMACVALFGPPMWPLIVVLFVGFFVLTSPYWIGRLIYYVYSRVRDHG